MAIVWPCLLSAATYAAAGQHVVVPEQTCPGCGRRLGGWSGDWRWVRAESPEQRIWIRRGRCAPCRTSHALLPDFLLVRRLDGVAVIGHGLALATSGWRLRTVATQLGVPYTTVRAWWRRFRARAPTLAAALAALAVRLDPAPVVLEPMSKEQVALESLGVVWQRARSRFGDRMAELWRFWSRISGGWALGTTTSSPLAGRAAAGWMAPSP